MLGMTRAGAALFVGLALTVWWWGWGALLVVLAGLTWLALSLLVCGFVGAAARERDTRRR
jgi:hypothetical protein